MYVARMSLRQRLKLCFDLLKSGRLYLRVEVSGSQVLLLTNTSEEPRSTTVGIAMPAVGKTTL